MRGIDHQYFGNADQAYGDVDNIYKSIELFLAKECGKKVKLSIKNAILLDKYTNTRTALTNNGVTEVAFAVDNAIAESTAANRFDIVFENLLGVNQNAFGNNIKLYPNPATDSFYIKVPSTESNLTVKVINALGQNVYNQVVTPQNGLAKIQSGSALKSGIYMVNISNGKNTTTQKLIIK